MEHSFENYDLFILYDISSFSFPETEEDLVSEIIEKATRLFEVTRIALIVNQANKWKCLCAFGFQEDEKLWKAIENENSNNFKYYFDGGNTGFFYLEQFSEVSRRDKRLYTIFARRIEEILRVKQMEWEQREFEKRKAAELQLLLDSIPIQVWYLKDEKTYGAANKAHADFLGKKKEELHNKNITEILPEGGQAIEENERVLQEKRQIDSEEWALNSRGEKRLLSITRIPTFDGNGNVEYIINSAQDITEKKIAENALKESEEKFKNIFFQSPIGIALFDTQGDLTDANQACLDIFGISDIEEARLFSLFRDPNLPLEVKENILDGRKERCILNFDFQLIKDMKLYNTWKSGASYLDCLITPLFSRQKIYGFMMQVQDITEQKLAEEKIRYLSFYDKVTGLYNRAYFEEELKRLDNERQMPLSLILGDVNGLKLINDTFGHHEGDNLLQSIAGILKNSCRKEDIIARWGGDEFAILLPKTSSKSVDSICKRIKEACNKANSKFPIQLSIALGTATKENPNRDIHSLLTEAEDIMYKNKIIEGKRFRDSIISSLKKNLQENTHETHEHAEQIQKICLEIGRKLELPENIMEKLELLAVFHDIGKIAVPAYILSKKGKLTEDEWETVKKHAELGYRIAQNSGLAHIAEDILHHHERWDGKGYPGELEAEEIPVNSRILAIAETYDVMTRGRCYKNKVSPPEALDEIKRCAGTQFDPYLVELFLESFSNTGQGKSQQKVE